jgi:hypothetical protein
MIPTVIENNFKLRKEENICWQNKTKSEFHNLKFLAKTIFLSTETTLTKRRKKNNQKNIFCFENFFFDK